MVLKRLSILASLCLTPLSASSEIVFNIVISDETDVQSREASGVLLKGVIEVFQSLQSAEFRDYDGSNAALKGAADRFFDAGSLLLALSTSEGMSGTFLRLENIPPRDRVLLYLWLVSYSDDPLSAIRRQIVPNPQDENIQELLDSANEVLRATSASEILELAGRHAAALSEYLLEDGPTFPIQRAIPLRLLIEQLNLINQVGLISTDAFDSRS